MNFIETYNMHANHSYNFYWDTVETITFSTLKPFLSLNKKIKVRLYHFYFEDIKCVASPKSLYLNSTTNSGIEENNIINPEINHEINHINHNANLYFEIHRTIFRIYHIYLTNTHVVLYSIPDAEIILQAYQQKNGCMKLTNLCPKAHTRVCIIQAAKKIVAKQKQKQKQKQK